MEEDQLSSGSAVLVVPTRWGTVLTRWAVRGGLACPHRAWVTSAYDSFCKGIRKGGSLGREWGAGGKLSSASNCALTRCDERIHSRIPCPQGLWIRLPQLTDETVVSADRKCYCA